MILSLSTTRKNYGLSLIFRSLVLVLVSILIQYILFQLDPIIIRSLGKEPLKEFIMFNTGRDSGIYIVLRLFIVFFGLASIWSLIASLNYRFGYMFWIVFFGFYLLGISTPKLSRIIMDVWYFVGELFMMRISKLQFIQLGLISLLAQLLSFLNITNTDIRSKS